jgi:hypothetical protein
MHEVNAFLCCFFGAFLMRMDGDFFGSSLHFVGGFGEWREIYLKIC